MGQAHDLDRDSLVRGRVCVSAELGAGIVAVSWVLGSEPLRGGGNEFYQMC